MSKVAPRPRWQGYFAQHRTIKRHQTTERQLTIPTSIAMVILAPLLAGRDRLMDIH